MEKDTLRPFLRLCAAVPYRNRSSSLDDSIQTSATDAPLARIARSLAASERARAMRNFPSSGKTSFCYVAPREIFRLEKLASDKGPATTGG